jgi:RNA polymerase sigma-70 factor, ECF subfamily
VAPQNPTLVAAAREHAPEAWDILLKQHQLPLYTYIAELVRNETTALDIVQETFAAAVRHIGTLRDNRRFGSWLFGIAHQKCIQHWRKSSRTEALLAANGDDEPISNLLDSDGDDPRESLLRRESADAFFALVEQLPTAQRATLLLHVIEDFSLEEISTITAVPIGTVKSRLHHAKRALRHLVSANL